MPIAGLHTSTTYCQGCINIAPVPYRVGQRICRLGVNDQLLWDLQDPWQRVKLTLAWKERHVALQADVAGSCTRPGQ